MPFRFCRLTLFALISALILQLNHGFEVEAEYDNDEGEQYKPRRWSAQGNGPYRLVVSAVELQPEESVALHVSSQEKKNIKSKPPEDKLDEDEIKFELNEKYDKVTQRALSKRGRKRDRYVLEVENTRKRRRNQSAHHVTTGLPHTMSYNLYNHFRPLEQDVPQDAIIPFLDFGRKLSKGVATTSGMNSIESSSTPRGDLIGSTEEIEDEENLFHEDMDVTVTKKAIERNAAPRGPVQQRQSLFTAYFRKTTNESSPTETPSTTPIGAITKVQNNQPEAQNNTNITNTHSDLQSNESGIKEHAILSPNYGLKFNKSENFTVTEPMPEILSNTTTSMLITENSTSPITEEPSTTTSATPNPTARILSTAVVTSVSVKESLRYPRIRMNYSSNLEPTFRNNSAYLKTEIPSVNLNLTNSNETFPTVDRPLRLDLGYFNNTRRKHYTTLRPKTTTYRPVTFRSTFRRNGSYVPAVVHVMSTPPSYIEVPKIIASNRTLITQKSPTDEAQISSSSIAPEIIVPNENNSSVDTVPISLASVDSARIFPEAPANKTETPTTFDYSHISTTSRSIKISQPSPSPILHTITAPDSDLELNTTLETSTPSIAPTTVERTSIKSTTIQTTSMPTTLISMDSETLTTSPELPATQPITEQTITTNKIPSTEQSTYKNNHNKTIIEFKSLDEKSEVNNTSELDAVDKIISSSTPTIKTTIKLSEEQLNATKKPGLSWIYNQRNITNVKTHSVSGVGVAYQESQIGLATYALAGLGIIPLLLGILVLVRQLLLKSKKKVLDESEYSSEYNRSPLPTKLPRVPAHINWEENKPAPVPVIQQTKWEFPREKLRLQTVLGQGNFGQVWKAEADDICDHEGLTRLVAVKSVKEGASQREKEDLLRELAIMQDLGAHPNVVTLLGCCTDKEPYLLIMEYVMYGKLLAFLREHRTRAHYFNFSDLSSALTARDLTVFSYCVARGMEYLSSKGIIHRDLAARNILVDHNKLCKIADFGMSRNVSDTGQIYEQRPNRGALPIRWMAPESLHFSLFTHKSDVWSFGILLWEIITLGSTPYNTMGAREVMRQVREGYRLEKPKHCKSEFYKIVTKCWHSDPTKRPTFTDLKQEIGALLGDKDTDGCYVDLEALTEEMSDQGH